MRLLCLDKFQKKKRVWNLFHYFQNTFLKDSRNLFKIYLRNISLDDGWHLLEATLQVKTPPRSVHTVCNLYTFNNFSFRLLQYVCDTFAVHCAAFTLHSVQTFAKYCNAQYAFVDRPTQLIFCIYGYKHKYKYKRHSRAIC